LLVATPMRADCAATLRSARRTSGLDRSSSAGKPVEMDTGGVGIFLLRASMGAMFPGWMASRAARRLRTTSDSCCSRGISASLVLNLAVASCSSSLFAMPSSRRVFMIFFDVGVVLFCLVGYFEPFLEGSVCDVVQGDFAVDKDHGIPPAFNLGFVFCFS